MEDRSSVRKVWRHLEGDRRMSNTNAFIAIVLGMLSSTGLWSYLQSRAVKRDREREKAGETQSASLRLLLGIAHDRIIFLGMGFKERGWISKDEYEDFFYYLGDPYSEFGGNGLAEKIMNDVKALPVMNHPQSTKPTFKEEPDE